MSKVTITGLSSKYKDGDVYKDAAHGDVIDVSSSEAERLVELGVAEKAGGKAKSEEPEQFDPATVEGPVVADDLTADKLKAVAAHRGVDLGAATTKADIADAINAAQISGGE